MSKIQASKADNKAIKELRAKFPSANIPTEIEEKDKALYHILCCFISITRGTNVEFKHRVVTTNERDYNNQVAKGIFNNASYLCDEIHILHDPMEYAKEEAERIAKEKQQPKILEAKLKEAAEKEAEEQIAKEKARIADEKAKAEKDKKEK